MTSAPEQTRSNSERFYDALRALSADASPEEFNQALADHLGLESAGLAVHFMAQAKAFCEELKSADAGSLALDLLLELDPHGAEECMSAIERIACYAGNVKSCEREAM